MTVLAMGVIWKIYLAVALTGAICWLWKETVEWFDRNCWTKDDQEQE